MVETRKFSLNIEARGLGPALTFYSWNMITLFHVTTINNAAGILRDGFNDDRGSMSNVELRGVFLSDRPIEDQAELEPIVLAVTFDLS